MSSLHNNLLFENFFSEIYSERWPNLRKALVQKEKQVLRCNLFQNHESKDFEKCDFLDNCYFKPEGYTLQKNINNLYDYYIMDPASVVVAKALEAKENESILDLCAAPGGKSLIIAEDMRSGELISNEMSEGRREKLMRVLHEYIPREERLFIKVKGLDGNQYGLRNRDQFDRVLADVPCSGERHLLENPSEFSLWTEKRSKNLAVRQYSLLSSAWLATKAGGRIVYSTCSISPLENDSVVQKLVKKRDVKIKRLNWLEKFDFLERTEYGYQILPDRCGFGPMYFAVIEK